MTKYFYAFKLFKEGLRPFPKKILMPKAIPEGGKRLIQVKVNFNEPEKECLDKIVEFYKSDRSSTLRKLLINWSNLEKYVVSIEEIKSKVSDICKNNREKLSKDILEKLYSLIEIADVLAEKSNDSDKFTKRKLINNISETKSSEQLIESNEKIVILKLFAVDEGNIIIDYLHKGNSVICDFSEFNFEGDGISDEFSFLKGGIYGIKAKTEKINNDIYIFTPNKTDIENVSQNKSSSYSIDNIEQIYKIEQIDKLINHLKETKSALLLTKKKLLSDDSKSLDASENKESLVIIRFNDAIIKIDKSINHLQKTKAALFLTKKNSLSVEKKSIDAEEAVLGRILLDPDAIGRIADLIKPEDFYIDAHQEIYKTALMLHTQYKPVGLTSISAWLADNELLEKIGGNSKLVELVENVSSTASIEQVANEVSDNFKKRIEKKIVNS